MDDKDKQVIKSSALVIADQIASNIPALNIAWGLSKGLLGTGLALRQHRALEWVEMVRDNPSIFTDIVLSNEKFQDGFVYTLENFMRERNEYKRKIIKNIFSGFATSQDFENFQLERYINILSLLGTDELSQLTTFFEKDVNTFEEEEALRWEYNNLINLGLINVVVQVDKTEEMKSNFKKILDPAAEDSHSREAYFVLSTIGSQLSAFINKI